VIEQKPTVTAPPTGFRGRFQLWLFVAVTLLHMLQVASTLRINNDAYRLLSLAWSAHSTGEFLVDGRTDQFPLGYPWMLRIMFDMGFKDARSICVLGLGWLIAALLGWWWMLRRPLGFSRDRVLVVLTVTLLSWITIKHAAVPLTEVPYLGVSTGALACLCAFWADETHLRWHFWWGALALALAGTQVRTIGISLVFVVVICLPLHPIARERLTRLRKRRLGFLLSQAVAGVTIACAAFLICRTDWFASQAVNPGSYLQMMFARFVAGGGENVFANCLRYRFVEITETVLNCPLARLPSIPGLPFIVGFGAIVAIVWSTKHAGRRSFPLVAYGGTYGAILAIWPYLDSRFLLPVMPVFVTLLAVGYSSIALPAPFRWAARTYFMAFALLGLAALAFSTRITFSGDRFPYVFGSGNLRDTYLYAFGRLHEANAANVDTRIVALLHNLEPRTVRAQKGGPDSTNP
jgi:hypothetical protein